MTLCPAYINRKANCCTSSPFSYSDRCVSGAAHYTRAKRFCVKYYGNPIQTLIFFIRVRSITLPRLILPTFAGCQISKCCTSLHHSHPSSGSYFPASWLPGSVPRIVGFVTVARREVGYACCRFHHAFKVLSTWSDLLVLYSVTQLPWPKCVHGRSVPG
jgi:hypothetical protein